MSFKSVKEQMESAFKSKPKMQREEIIEFDNKLRENLLKSSSSQLRSLSILYTLLAVWFVLAATGVDEISLIGMTFKDFSIPFIALPPIAAFFYYQYMLWSQSSQMIKTASRVCQKELFRRFHKYRMGELALYDAGFWDIESELELMEEGRSLTKTITQLSILTFSTLVTLLPSIIFIIIVIWLIVNPEEIDTRLIPGSVILTLLLLVWGLRIYFGYSLREKVEREWIIEEKQRVEGKDRVVQKTIKFKLLIKRPVGFFKGLRYKGLRDIETSIEDNDNSESTTS